jgi:hypothetical protein
MCAQSGAPPFTFNPKHGGTVMRARLVVLSLVLLLGVLTSGCISIEQEIFLQPDGSGELLLLLTLPDLPDDAKNGIRAGNPAEALQKFKTEIAAKLPPTIKLKEAKELRRNGSLGFYALFHFKDLNEVGAIMANVMVKSTQELPGGGKKPSEWKVKFEKQGNTHNFTQVFYADTSDTKVETSGNLSVAVKPQAKPAPAKSDTRNSRRPATRQAAAKSSTPEAVDSGEMQMNGMEGLTQMMLGAVKFRFVLHTPTPITTSNADLVLSGRTALWNCSLAAFAKENKPIELKVSF